MKRFNFILYSCFLPALFIALRHQPQDKCEEAKAASAKLTRLAGTKAFSNAITIIKTAGKDGHEHLLVFGKDTTGSIKLSSLKTAGAKNAVPAEIGFPGAFADVHNHPGNSTPSSGDLYNLISRYKKDAQFDTRITLLANGSIYALAIVNAEWAAAFAVNYPPEQTSGFSPRFPEQLFNEFAELKSYLIKVKDTGKMEADEMATAYILDKYNTGIALFRLNADNRFERVYVIKGNDNASGISYTRLACKD